MKCKYYCIIMEVKYYYTVAKKINNSKKKH